LKPIFILNLQSVNSVHSGYDTSFIFQNGELWCCGKNDFGHLGLGDKQSRSTFEKLKLDKKVKKFQTSSHHSILLSGKYFSLKIENGDVYTFGYNDSGQLGIGNEDDKSTQMKIDIEGKVINLMTSNRGSFIIMK
jgi:alpha-tubulin suppressor-like RCC1 family protein